MSDLEIEKQKRLTKKHIPLIINLSDALKINNEKQKKKKEKSVIRKNTFQSETLPSKPANILDASSPQRQYGKKRENQKPKKLSALKSVILQERESKKIRNTENDINNENLENETTNMKLINAKDIIHSRNFRHYCDHLLMEEINYSVTILLKDLVRFQERMYQENPMKAHAKKRYVLGFKETLKNLNYNKLKLIIIAPNLENIVSKGGVNDLIDKIKNISNEKNVPYVFSLNRNTLGRLAHKNVPASVIGIINYEGSEENYKNIVNLILQAKKAYQIKTIQVLQSFSKNSENDKIEESFDQNISSSIQESQKETIKKDINEEVIDSFLNLLIESIKGRMPVTNECEPEFLKAIERCSVE